MAAVVTGCAHHEQVVTRTLAIPDVVIMLVSTLDAAGPRLGRVSGFDPDDVDLSALQSGLRMRVVGAALHLPAGNGHFQALVRVSGVPEWGLVDDLVRTPTARRVTFPNDLQFGDASYVTLLVLERKA